MTVGLAWSTITTQHEHYRIREGRVVSLWRIPYFRDNKYQTHLGILVEADAKREWYWTDEGTTRKPIHLDAIVRTYVPRNAIDRTRAERIDIIRTFEGKD